jgi:hypothetical protein
MSELFIAQRLIIERIKARVPDFVTVANPSAIAGLTTFSGVLPACIVAPSLSEITSFEERGNLTVEEQRWDVVILVAHQAGDDGTEMLAGDLMTKTIRALSNFNLGAGFVRPMKYAGRPELPNYTATFAEFIMTFKVKKIVGD